MASTPISAAAAPSGTATAAATRDHKPNPTLGTIEKPPFYAMPFKASFLGTKGGARTNERAEVLDQNDTPDQPASMPPAT